MLKFIGALICFLETCLVGYVFIYWGRDTRGGWPISPLVIYAGLAVWASPFWLFTFVPPFLFASSKSMFWRWYISPLAGVFIGLLSSVLVFGKMEDSADTGAIQIQLTPVVIGFSLFLLGSLAKKIVPDESDA